MRSSDAHVFKEGDHATITDRRGRRHLVLLGQGDRFESHLGFVTHDTIIGSAHGSRIKTNRGHKLLVLPPTLAEHTLYMPRIATVVYPKDLGSILVYGDIFPGASVVEAGAGSGAVTMTLARAIGPNGHLTTYDLREDMIERASTNAANALGETSNVTFKIGDVYEGFDETSVDRIVLDLPEPWHTVPHAACSLAPGGLILCFLPTVLQVHDLTIALRKSGRFDAIETLEVMMRQWSVGTRSVRPNHRMVGHTGFITTARLCELKLSDESDEPQGRDQQPA